MLPINENCHMTHLCRKESVCSFTGFFPEMFWKCLVWVVQLMMMHGPLEAFMLCIILRGFDHAEL